MFGAEPGLDLRGRSASSSGPEFSLSHFFEFEKFALVSDTEWINNTVKVMGFMMPCPVQRFALADRDAAKDWISG
jgi:hypothetical protein